MDGPVIATSGQAVAAPRWYAKRSAEINAAIADQVTLLKSTLAPHGQLADAVEYSLCAGGKRLRPVLVLEACAACGGEAPAALPAAVAVECVHTFSLIHDDLPAMDDDELRRGQPTNHRVFGEAAAILAGDWLLAHAFAVLAQGGKTPAVAQAWARELAAGSMDMIAGQALDVASEGRPADRRLVEQIHRSKTARLIETCCRMGAIAAAADEATSAHVAAYGRHLGLAFQIVDDLLDVGGDEAAVGKRVGKDAGVAKQTYPAAFGVAASRAQRERELAAALDAVAPLGGHAERLCELAQFVAARDR